MYNPWLWLPGASVVCPADLPLALMYPVNAGLLKRDGATVRGVLGMGARRSLGRQFGWLWAAYTVSTFGTRLAFDAFPLIAILVLHAGPTEVSVLAAAGLAVGAAVAVPLGPWVEFEASGP